MKVELLQEKVNEILAYLRKVPYADSTVRYYGFCYQNLLQYLATDECDSFGSHLAAKFSADQMERVKSGEITQVYALIMRKAAFVLADYVQTGQINCSRRRYNERILSKNYAVLLQEFESSLKPILAPGSVKNIVQLIRQFLFFLEDNDCYEITAISHEHIREFIILEAPKHKGNIVNLTWPVKKFFTYLSEHELVSIKVDALLANPAPAHKKVLPCLERDEVSELFESAGVDTPLAKRDTAIMMLSLDMGLRGIDIINLLLSDIDWRKNELRIVQDKTDTALVLPLMPEAGNAVADYILNYRPKSDDPHVFLRTRRPYTSLRSGGANIIRRYQKACGFEHHAGDGKTFHALRRTAGTNLIRSGAPLTTVSQILGHTNLDSTKRYLSFHDEMLSECCMDMSGLLTQKEGLI